MKQVNWCKQINKHSPSSLDLIRIYLGVILFFQGMHFINHKKEIMLYLQQGHIDVIPSLIVHYVVVAHLVGGFLLIIGLITRAAALIQVPILMGAVFLVNWPKGFFSIGQSLEYSLIVLLLLILLSIFGSNYYSVDKYLHK